MSSQLPNPFPGLRPFRSDEHHLFFGRDEQTAALLQLLRTNRFLAVVGTSGSGKSSLVRAGMIAELHGGTMTQAGSSWEVMILRPGGSPIENLARAFVKAGLYEPDDTSTLPRLLATLNRSRYGLVEAIKQSDLMEPGTNLLLVVDQFEELFRFRQQGMDSEEAAAAFVNLLLTASEQSEFPIYITITMRSDYLGECSGIPGLAEAVNEGEYLIPRLLRDQKREAIEKPIGVGGARVSPMLVQRLLNEVGDDPDQLPVLQHALMRMWDVWCSRTDHDRPIDFVDFDQTGGLTWALSNHADEIYDSLPDDAHRSVCEKIFKTLTEKCEDNRGIHRPTRLSQLQAIAQTDRATIAEVLNAFRGSGVTFLMPGPEVDLTDSTVLDLSHESLMRGWYRLRGWVDDEAQSARIFRRLLDTARLWSDGKAGLFRGPDLQVALSWREQQTPSNDWAEQYGGNLATALKFLDSSNAEAVTEQQSKEAARQRELEQARQLAEAQRQRLEQQQRAAVRLRIMIVGLAAIASIAVFAFAFALVARNEADRLAKVASDEKEKAQASETVAIKAKVTSEQERDNARREKERAESTLYNSRIALAERAWQANDVHAALQQLGLCVPADGEFDRRSWDWQYLEGLCHTELARSEDPETPMSVVFSPDKRFLLSSTNIINDPSGKSMIRVRDPHNANVITSFQGPAASGLRFSQDGKRLIVDDQNLNMPGTRRGLAAYAIESWQPVPLDPSDSEPVAYESMFEKEISVAGWRTIRIAVRDNDRNYPLTGHNGTIGCVAISPNGKLIATGGDDQTIRVWDRKGEPKGILRGHKASVESVAFSPDGLRLASASVADLSVRIWDLTRDQRGIDVHYGAPLLVHSFAWGEWLGNFAFGADSQTINTIFMEANGYNIPNVLSTLDLNTSSLRSSRILPSITFATSAELLTRGGRATAISADGRFVAGPRRGFPSGLSICSTATGDEILAMPILPRAVAFSSDGAKIAVATTDSGMIRIWDTMSGEELNSLEPIDLSPAERLALYRTVAEKANLTGQPWVVLQRAALGLAMDPELARDNTAHAVAWGRESIEINAEDPICHQALGVALLRSNEWQEAADSLVKANELSPEPTSMNDFAIALCYANLGQESEARRLYERAIAAEPKQPSTESRNREQLKFEAATQLGLDNPSKPNGLPPAPFFARPVRLEFSSDDGTLVAGLAGGGVAFWDCRTGLAIGRNSNFGQTIATAFRHDGRRVAVVDATEGKLIMFDVPSARQIFRVNGPGGAGRLESVAFNPDGRRIAAAGRSGDVGIMDAETGQTIINLRRLTPPSSGSYGFRALVAFSPDGQRLAATGFNGPSPFGTSTIILNTRLMSWKTWRKNAPQKSSSKVIPFIKLVKLILRVQNYYGSSNCSKVSHRANLPIALPVFSSKQASKTFIGD